MLPLSRRRGRSEPCVVHRFVPLLRRVAPMDGSGPRVNIARCRLCGQIRYTDAEIHNAQLPKLTPKS